VLLRHSTSASLRRLTGWLAGDNKINARVAVKRVAVKKVAEIQLKLVRAISGNG